MQIARSGASRHLDLLFAALLFAALAVLSWRRWASFGGDLSREWTTPARVAAGERLYADVAYYYGPLAPWTEGLAMRVFGARVGTAIGFGLVSSAATLALLIVASRSFLPLAGRLALASVAVGVFAFAPGNGAFVACYSQSALLAVALTWLAFLFASRDRSGGAGAAAGLALLGKTEALAALAGALVALRTRRLLGIAIAAALVAAGSGIALAGIPVAELVRYGPLRHAAMPAEFQELYQRISGLHPALRTRGILGALDGAALLLGWALAVPGIAALVERARAVGEVAWPAGAAARAAAGAGLLAAGTGLHPLLGGEPWITTLVRGVPLACVAALAVAWRASRVETDADARRESALAAAAAVAGLGFAWRTFFWTVPSLPYAPLAAVSSVPAICWLVSRGTTGRIRALVLAPLLAAPLFFLPRLVLFYLSPRTCVAAPRGTWCPPGDEGELFGKLVAHLTRTGVKDRSLVAVPEAGALGFLLGVRSPLRLEQLLPGLVDDAADADAAARLTAARPERVVFVDRPTPEFGGKLFGRDYGLGLTRAIDEGYVEEARFSAGELGARVLVRKDLAVSAPAPAARTRS